MKKFLTAALLCLAWATPAKAAWTVSVAGTSATGVIATASYTLTLSSSIPAGHLAIVPVAARVGTATTLSFANNCGDTFHSHAPENLNGQFIMQVGWVVPTCPMTSTTV
ncbi:MAG TPA: hypothetical protein VGO07_01955, partial [Candidatus Saccharimonadales bacterium]|nr:hypothetical protein [Candidatus Saccharimonadales bacterium]